MVKRIGTARRKTRGLYSIKHRDKGKIKIRDYLQSFNEGDKVILRIRPNVQSGIPFRRFVGLSGIVIGKQGEAYKVSIKDMNKQKIALVHPLHLKRMN